MTRVAPAGQRLRGRTAARPAFKPVAVKFVRWLNPESPGTMHFGHVSLSVTSMELALLRAGETLRRIQD